MRKILGISSTLTSNVFSDEQIIEACFSYGLQDPKSGPSAFSVSFFHALQ